MTRPAMLALALVVAVAATAAAAHSLDATDSYAAGVRHALTRWDHVAPCAALGLWAGLSGRRANWALPLAYLLAVMGGMGLGAAGITPPFLSDAFAMLAVSLGLLTLLRVETPLAVGVPLALIAGAIFGRTHGDLAGWAGILAAPTLGLLTGVLALTLVGVVFAQLKRFPSGEFVTRLGGAAATGLGLWSLSILLA